MMHFRKQNKIQKSAGDRVLDVITTVLLILVTIIVGYPVWYTIICSISGAKEIATGKILFLPMNINLDGYLFVFKYKDVWLGFRNTVFYTVVGTLLTMTVQIICAWPISRNKFNPRHVYVKIILITMLVNAGLIPNYLIKAKLGMVNTVWPILLNALISSSDLFILRTCYRSSIPQELFDAAEIDGADDFQCLFKIAVPLAKATISVLTLYTIVAHWNNYFTAMIYLHNKDLYPLSLFLRTILTATNRLETGGMSSSMAEQASNAFEQIKYCLIIVSTVPVLAAYACVQKFFKTGVMIGSVKG